MVVISIGSALASIIAAWLVSAPGLPQRTDTLTLRGKIQTLHLYGERGGEPVVVSSGDGGWIHLGPHVAQTLASRGFFVVGFDARGYLAGFTSGRTTLRPEDEPGDYRALADFAAAGGSRKPILIGVSEGAGLSVLAATDARTRAAIAGVIALGLPDLNELGWRWRDALIYLTHTVPQEPTFSSASVIDKVAPLPLAAIHSTKDEFVSVADVQNIFERARPPKHLWIVSGSDHRFSGNLAEFDRRLIEAIEWVKSNSPR